MKSCQKTYHHHPLAMPILTTKAELQDFRTQLYQTFKHRRDSLMELLDALCSNHRVSSVVELSLNPLFRRKHDALYKAIGESFSISLPTPEESPSSSEGESSFSELIAQVVPSPEQRSFYLFGLDCTPMPRPHSPTLEDRGMVYQPTPVKGNKPITIGHRYSMLAALPARHDQDAPWTIPLEMSRVPSQSNSRQVGQAQVKGLFSNSNAPWSQELCVLTVDSDYGNKKFLGDLQPQKDLVTIARVRGNRVFSRLGRLRERI